MSFLKLIEEIRQRARQTMEDGAVTHDYRLDRAQAVRVLNEALATEIVCVLRYKFHSYPPAVLRRRNPRALGCRPRGPYVNGMRCQGKRVSMMIREGIRSKAEHRFSNLRAIIGQTYVKESQKEKTY